MALAAALDKARRDLLELGSRNRLIHTPLEGKRKSWLTIVEERSDNVFELLVRKTKTMSFLPKTEAADSDDDRQAFLNAFNGEPDSMPAQVREKQLPASSELASEHTASELFDSGDNEEKYTDNWLQTNLSKDKLHDHLLRAFYDARTAEEEQGVSILYLACGILKWRESASSDVNRYAPLLLIPVELSRNSAQSKFQLRFRDDEIVTNLSIQARLLQDFGIKLPNIPEDARDDDGWSPSVYFQTIREVVSDHQGWEVLDNEILLWFFSFTKFLMYRDLSPESWPTDGGLMNNELIQALLGEGFGSQPNSLPTIGDDQPVDSILNPADVIHVTDADSSQAIVIDEIAKGHNLVVQGPPGTGKSQTITNAIAAAIHAGKRVLFVSEKMAALEVVKRRLVQVGLGPMTLELHSNKARKTEVLQELKEALELGVPTSNIPVPVTELRETALRLRQHDEVLHANVGNSGRSPYQAMGQLIRLRKENKVPLTYSVRSVISWSPDEFQLRKRVAEELDRLLAVSGDPVKSVWRGARCAPMLPSDLERLVATLEQVRQQLSAVTDASTQIAELLSLPSAENLSQSSQLAQLAAHMKRCPAKLDTQALSHPNWDSDLSAVEAALENIRSLQEATSKIAGVVSDVAWMTDLAPTRIALAAHGRSWLRLFNSEFRKAIATLRGVCMGPIPKSAEERVALVDALLNIQQRRQQLQTDQNTVGVLLGELWAGESTDIPSATSVVEWVKQGQKSAYIKQHQRTVASRLRDKNSLLGPLSQVAENLKSVDTTLSAIIQQLKLDVSKAFEASESRAVSFPQLQTRLTSWLDARESLSHHLATSARLEKLRELGLGQLADEVEAGTVKAGEVVDRLELIRSEAVLGEAWSTRPQLAEFHGDTFEELRKRFCELDQQRISLSQLEVACKHQQELPSLNASGGQVNIVKREINKKRRHKPIRALLKDAGQVIQKIKPVFMMSPLSVAQYLAPGAVEFDLLVIDEASQVQPVDALGAIARCKQIVVVGDQRQLPPTNFFGRIAGDGLDDDDNGETTNAGDVESILGLCEAQGLPNRMLRWHYRSRHESLIAVSNRRFYDNRLFIVPSPVTVGGPSGLKFRYVAQGWYDRGGSRVNREEAIAVAEAVLEHAKKTPELSLGVATFSSAQRDAIIDEIEARRRNQPGVESFFTPAGAEPFFVKSIENVQGDQRDVMFISIGYARDRGGYFGQNFGPLNREGGERRLNVLISRAAEACEVFTSIKADDIDLSRSQSEGVAALKMYLHYAEKGHLDEERSYGEADSVFEEQVADALRARGLQVDHQIGVGGFFIDLAIRDPDRSGRYLLGIECDGAQYHSARWVRDRDRLRQQILESRGWRIHRIWSTDWFQRPGEQLQHVIDAFAEAKAHWAALDAAEAGAAPGGAQRLAAPEGDAAPVWERAAPAATEEATQIVDAEVLYQEAAFTVSGFIGGPNDLPVEQLAKLVQRIAQIEAPVHVDEIARRCVKVLASGRMSASLKRKIALAVKSLSGQVVERNGFVYLEGNHVSVIRNRRELDNANLRRVDFVAPEELRAAILRIVAEHIGTDETETAAGAAKLLGMSCSKAFQAAVGVEIQYLVERELVSYRLDKLFIADPADHKQALFQLHNASEAQ